MFQKLANSEGVGLQTEKILDDFIWNDPYSFPHSLQPLISTIGR